MNDLRSFESPVTEPAGLDRRSFVKVVTMAAAAVGLVLSPEDVALLEEPYIPHPVLGHS